MKKTIRLTESDLTRLVGKIIQEQAEQGGMTQTFTQNRDGETTTKTNVNPPASSPKKPIPGVIDPEKIKDGGKSVLIRTMIAKLNNMSNDPNFDADAVARVIYNNAAHFFNKTDIFRDQNKFGKPFPVRVPFAPQTK